MALRKGEVKIGDLLVVVDPKQKRENEYCRVIEFSSTGLPFVIFFEYVLCEKVGNAGIHYRGLKPDCLEPSSLPKYKELLHKGKDDYLKWRGHNVYHFYPRIEYSILK